MIFAISDTLGREDSLFTSRIGASDVDSLLFGDQLRYSLVTKPSWITIDSMTGVLSGIPMAYSVGDTTLTVSVNDQLGGFAQKSFNLHIVHTNHAPVFISSKLPDAVEDSLYHHFAGAVDSDSTMYGDYVLYAILFGPSWMRVDSVTGIISGIPAALRSLDTVVVIKAQDNNGASATQSFPISILHTNHAPVIGSISKVSAEEDSLFSSTISAEDADIAYFGDTLRYQLLVKPSWLSISTFGGVISGVPRGPNVGDTVIIVRVDDGYGGADTASYSITITHTNHSPVFAGFSPVTTTIEDELYTQSVRAADQDSALFGDVVKYRLISTPAPNAVSWLAIDSVSGMISGTPRVHHLNDTVVVVEAYDNAGGAVRQQYNLRIRHVNHIPEIVSVGSFTAQEDTLYTYQIIAEDPDTLIGDQFTYSLTKRPSWLSVNSSGLVSGIPRGKNVGDTIVTVRVSDGKGGIASESYAIKVSHTNHAPVFVTTADTTAVEDSLYTYRVKATDQDTLLFGDQVRYRLSVRPAWLSIDSITGQIVGIPSGMNALDTVVAVQSYDNKGGISTQRYTLRVEHVNHEPEFTSIPVTEAREDSLYRYQVSAYDPDQLLFGDTLFYRLRVKPSWMSIDSLTGLITGIPAGKDVGDTVVTVRVRDDKGGLIVQSFTVTVIHTNHAPVFVTLTLPGAVEDSLYTYAVRATDQDSALFGDEVRYRLTIKPVWLSIDSITGMLSGTASGGSALDTTLTVQAYDNKEGSVLLTLPLSVEHVNHPPVIVSLPDTTAIEDSPYLYQVVAFDVDSKYFGDSISFSLLKAPNFLQIDTLTGKISGIPILVDTILKPELFSGAKPVARKVERKRDNNLSSHGEFNKQLDVAEAPSVSVKNATNDLDLSTYQMFDVSVRIADGKDGMAFQNYTLSVKHVNHSPFFVSQPVESATEDSLYSYSIKVYDVDSEQFGDSILISPIILPSWLRFDAESSVVYGTPRGLNAVDSIVSMKVSDGKGGEAVQSYFISMTNVNHSPVIVSVGDTIATEEFEYQYVLKVNDPDVDFGRDSLKKEFVIVPSWLNVVHDTLIGTPQYNNVGDTIVLIRITDVYGIIAQQQWSIQVSPTRHAPAPFTLNTLSHADTIALDWGKNLSLSWSRAFDADTEDTLRYSIHLFGGGFDTLIVNLSDTMYSAKIMNRLRVSSKYFWTVSVNDGSFEVLSQDTLSFHTSSKILNVAEWKYTVPNDFVTLQNYPNPFNASTMIRFGVPVPSHVSVELYNAIGQRVTVLFDNQIEAQYREVKWNADRFSSGIYFAVIKMRDINENTVVHRFIKKMILLK